MAEFILAIAFVMLILIVVFGSYLIYSLIFSVPYYPSRIRYIDQTFDVLGIPANKDIKFLDLGSGDGAVVGWANDKGMTAHGIEINPFLSLFSRLKHGLKGRRDVKIENKNFFNADLRDYNVVYMYLYNSMMDKMRPKLEKELKQGSVIISNTFKFSDWEPDQELGRFKIYYIK